MKLGTVLSIITAATAPLLVGNALAQTAPEDHGNWTVSCDEDLYCVAETIAYGPDGARGKFKLERSARPNGKLFVTTAPHLPLELGMRVEIDVNDTVERYGVYGEVTRVYRGNEMTFAGDPRRKLVLQMREGNDGTVAVDFGGSVGQVRYSVSLVGVTPVLLYMDRMQNRIESNDAAVAWGGLYTEPLEPSPQSPSDDQSSSTPAVAEAPTSPPPPAHRRPVSQPPTPPAPPATQSVVSGDFQLAGSTEWADILYEIGQLPPGVISIGTDRLGCDLPDVLQAYGAHVHAIGDELAIYVVPCNPADVNVETFVAMVYDSDPNFAILMEFAGPPQWGTEGRQILINAQWDSNVYGITATAYMGPDADCGTYERHFFVRGQEIMELQEVREKTDCSGQWSSPEEYPLVWSRD